MFMLQAVLTKVIPAQIVQHFGKMAFYNTLAVLMVVQILLL
jgi:hypothetical protein